MDRHRAARLAFEVFRSTHEHDELYKRWSLHPWGEHRYWFEMDDDDLRNGLSLLEYRSLLGHNDAGRFQLTLEGAQACIRPGLFEKLLGPRSSATASSGVMLAVGEEKSEEAKRSA